MRTKTLHARRIGPTLTPDRSRVLLRPFHPTSEEIARRVVARVLSLADEEVAHLLDLVLGEFSDRHEHVERQLRNRFKEVSPYLDNAPEPSPQRQALIGAYFTHEYSPESAALFNPSIVPHPDQSGVAKGALRFILSLRSTGEGHISSITFRVGAMSAQHRVTLKPLVPFVTEPERAPNPEYAKALFARKLEEAGLQNDFSRHVLEQLPEIFVLDDLQAVLANNL